LGVGLAVPLAATGLMLLLFYLYPRNLGAARLDGVQTRPT
jgi:hypothetical protein